MEITVRSVSGEYAEVVLKEGNTTIDIGTLGEKEIKELAITFIEAADDLLCYMRADTGYVEEIIVKLVENLDTI